MFDVPIEHRRYVLHMIMGLQKSYSDERRKINCYWEERASQPPQDCRMVDCHFTCMLSPRRSMNAMIVVPILVGAKVESER